MQRNTRRNFSAIANPNHPCRKRRLGGWVVKAEMPRSQPYKSRGTWGSLHIYACVTITEPHLEPVYRRVCVWLRGTLASEVDTSPPQREVSVAASWSTSGLCLLSLPASQPADVLEHQMSFAQKSVLMFSLLFRSISLKAVFAFTARGGEKK